MAKKIIEAKIADLIPDDKNFNKGTEYGAHLMDKSFREFGAGRSILLDKNNRVIAGNKSLQTFADVGLDKVRIIETTGDELIAVKRVDVDLDSKRGREMALADNATSKANLDWDEQQLKDECEAYDINAEDWGVMILDESVTEDEQSENESDPTDVVDDNVEQRVADGDIWQLGNHKLLCGDSTKADSYDKLLQGDNVTLCLTDPPYGIAIVHKDGRVGSEKKANSKGKRVTGARVYAAFEGDETTDTAKLAYEQYKDRAAKLVIWGANYFLDFLPNSDSWLIWDKRCQDDMRNNFADGEMAWCNFHTPVRIYHQMWNGMIREGESAPRVHPTQKPVRLLHNIIKDFDPDGDVVLDCFGGSGSTLIACEQLGRACRMIEYSKHYCDVIINRWEQITGNKATKLN